MHAENLASEAPILVHGQVVQVPVDMLQRDPNQPRIKFEPEALKALAADIAARGIELPIVVRGDYTIKDGERRWRAAKIAKLVTVPCLLAGATAGEEGDFAVNWKLDQVADNHHREPLNALDWARFLRDLVDVHGIPVKDIPAVLAKRGIVYSRSYVSNLIRLVELPDWAKDMINDGRITAAHGKHILTAKDSPAATEAVRQAVLDGLSDEDAPITVADMPHIIFEAFEQTHISLDRTHGANAVRFDVATCDKCPSRKTISANSWTPDGKFCLDAACFEKKQAAAAAQAKSKDADNGSNGSRTATQLITPRAKPDAKTAAGGRRVQQVEAAKKIAAARAVEAVVATATGAFSREDLLLIIEVGCDWQSITDISKRRGWESKSRDWLSVFNKRLKKMSDAELTGIIMEAVVTSSSANLAIAAKQRGIDIKALEKAALEELTAADKKADKKPAKKAPAGKAVSQ